MSRQNGRKINQLLKVWPKATVVTKQYLDELGFYRQLIAKYVHYSWMERLGTGAYVRSGDTVGWQGALFALQTQLEMTVHVGGVTALELQGRTHFVPLGERKRVTLISDRPEHLPTWFRKHQWKDEIEHRCLSLFGSVPPEATTKLECGGFQVAMASAERAIMEQIHLAGGNDDIENVLHLMEGLTTLRPDIAQKLLESCRSVKVKRVFLWSAETSGHAWFNRLDLSRFDLGQGKRQIYKGGRLNHRYGITVPEREGLPGV